MSSQHTAPTNPLTNINKNEIPFSYHRRVPWPPQMTPEMTPTALPPVCQSAAAAGGRRKHVILQLVQLGKSREVRRGPPPGSRSRVDRRLRRYAGARHQIILPLPAFAANEQLVTRDGKALKAGMISRKGTPALAPSQPFAPRPTRSPPRLPLSRPPAWLWGDTGFGLGRGRGSELDVGLAAAAAGAAQPPNVSAVMGSGS